MPRNLELIQIRPILAHAAAGYFTLPDAVVEATATLAALEGLLATSQAPPAADTARRAAIAAFRAAATGQESTRGLEKAVAVAEDADRLAALRVELVGEALEAAEMAAYSAVVDSEHAIIVDHLRPALAEVVGQVREAATLAPDVPWQDPRALAGSSDAVRAAYETVTVAAARYGAIREAQSSLARLVGSPSGDAALYCGWAKVESVRRAWPGFPGNGYLAGKAPWPDDAAPRLAWLVGHGVELWIPTGDEASAAFTAFVASEKERQRHRSPLQRPEAVVLR